MFWLLFKIDNTSALYHPKLIDLVAGLVASHRLNKEIMKDAKSVKRWAASVAIAKLLAIYPPVEMYWFHF
jgi:hypothetical protein